MVGSATICLSRRDGELPGGQCCAPRRRPGGAINYRVKPHCSVGPSCRSDPVEGSQRLRASSDFNSAHGRTLEADEDFAYVPPHSSTNVVAVPSSRPASNNLTNWASQVDSSCPRRRDITNINGRICRARRLISTSNPALRSSARPNSICSQPRPHARSRTWR
jgi:hypothetical protein